MSGSSSKYQVNNKQSEDCCCDGLSKLSVLFKETVSVAVDIMSLLFALKGAPDKAMIVHDDPAFKSIQEDYRNSMTKVNIAIIVMVVGIGIATVYQGLFKTWYALSSCFCSSKQSEKDLGKKSWPTIVIHVVLFLFCGAICIWMYVYQKQLEDKHFSDATIQQFKDDLVEELKTLIALSEPVITEIIGILIVLCCIPSRPTRRKPSTA